MTDTPRLWDRRADETPKSYAAFRAYVALGARRSGHFDNLQLLCGACNSVKGDRPHAHLIATLQKREVIAGPSR